MIIIAFVIVHWYASLFFQTFYHHRYAAHSMFKMSRGWEKTFYVMSWIGQGSSYLSPYIYGVLHRQHHAFTDTEKDPHSPSYDPNLFAMMWRTKVIYSDYFYGREPISEKWTKGVPRWDSFDKFANAWPTRLGWMAAYTAFYFFFATSPWLWLLLPLNFVMGPFHGAIINWFAHKYGYTNFKEDNTSKNLMPLDVFMMGEGYHNNHHHRGSNPNFGYHWYELDPTYPIILLLDKLKVIQLRQATA